MLQRQVSLDREDTETGLEALEEPLKAKKRRESRQGTQTWQSRATVIIAGYIVFSTSDAALYYHITIANMFLV